LVIWYYCITKKSGHW